MKFINYLESITGVGIYPLTSLAVFFLFFSIVAIWALKADKGYIKEMKDMPFPEQEYA
jgi:cytochrome c oxidase cbb3-type subunit 3